MDSDNKYNVVDEMHRTARGFINTAKMLCKDEYSFDYYPLYAPVYAVNLSFACELSLKEILLLIDKSYDNSHYLDKLFYSLPPNIQKKVQLNYSKKFANKKIGKCLKKYRNAFVIWRYLYEQVGEIPVPYDDLMEAVNSIRLVAKELYQNYAKSIGKEIDYAD